MLTMFRIASITKPFTATAIMMLRECGKLNISDPICKYLADCPAAWQPITIKHLFWRGCESKAPDSERLALLLEKQCVANALRRCSKRIYSERLELLLEENQRRMFFNKVRAANGC